ncbi:MAG: ABC transporter permease [Bacteroidota bacterium]
MSKDSKDNNSPPLWATRFLRWYCRSELLDEVEGDVYELFQRRVEARGLRQAKLLYWLNVLMFFHPDYIRKRNHYPINHTAMFQNYFKVTFRNLLRYKLFSFINIFGLAAGMSICLLIIAMLAEQKSYDQFHRHKDRIYRIITQPGFSNQTASTSALLTEALADYPIVEKTTRLRRGFGGDATHNQTTIPLIGFFADSTLLTLFDFPMKYGDPEQALTNPFSIVLSEEVAGKLFDRENPVGQTISFTQRGLSRQGEGLGAEKGESYGDFTVTGVLAKTSQKSHIPLDAFMSYSTRHALHRQDTGKVLSEKWSDIWNTYTYILLEEETSPTALTEALDQVAERAYASLDEKNRFSSQALTQITPAPMINNELSQLLPVQAYYFLGLLALLIMLTAGFNYTNLSIARSLARAKEVGVRKVSGAFRHHLFGQFVGESVIMALLALILSVLFFQLLKVGFVNLWVNQHFHFDLPESPSLYLYFVLFGLLVGLLAGIYPAIYMSRYTPLMVLKNFKIIRPGGLGVRKVMITAQFTISLMFIVTAIIFYQQLDQYLHLEYGFSKENILNVDLQGQSYESVAHQLGQVNTVETISGCWFVPGSGITMGKDVKREEDDEMTNLSYMVATPNYFDNHQIPIVAGRSFTVENARSEVVLNEKAIELLGFTHPQEAVGTPLIISEFGETATPLIVGVVKDFQDGMPVGAMNPLLLHYDSAKIKVANVRILPTDVRSTLADLEVSWKQIDPQHALEASFLEDQLNASLQAFVDIVKVFGLLTFLAISVACLGLLGMVMFTAESRIKEIGVRKVLGANVRQLVFVLSKGFLQLWLLSVFIALPLAYFGNNLWLQNFANHITLGPGIFLSGTAVMLGLGLLVVVSQTMRTAVRNPVDSLRNE